MVFDTGALGMLTILSERETVFHSVK